MRRSRLETYEVILEALMKKPMKIDRLAYKVGLDCAGLRRYLDFLIENGLVEELILPKGTSYAATDRGMSVFRTLDFQKYLKKLSKTLMTIDEAMQDIPAALKRRQKPPE